MKENFKIYMQRQIPYIYGCFEEILKSIKVLDARIKQLEKKLNEIAP
jgi:hypothetical protein